ncbi:MAG: hypothetical protein HY815_30980 [Candidatus Riflebacteria bacterium]|nr:hypothetical protein [Candidatus Riflebacteria bacterium]
MDEKLTWEEIKKKYPDEWVILLDYEDDPAGADVLSGIVFAHSSDERELLDSTKLALTGKERAILYTGDINEGNYVF